jgi:DNA-binding transcriptional regulator of glucitol operon
MKHGVVQIAMACWVASSVLSQAQIIHFESGGLQFQTLTKNGVTVMVAPLPQQIREYSIMQIAVSNGSKVSWTVKPEEFEFFRRDGGSINASSARQVVGELIAKGSRGDVIKLVQTYEMSLYGLSRYKSTNGYEQRRQAAFAEVSSTKIKAAAAASAVAFPSVKLLPGQSTDGAVFYPTGQKGLGTGRLRVRVAGELFEFDEMFTGGQ